MKKIKNKINPLNGSAGNKIKNLTIFNNKIEKQKLKQYN